LSGNLIEPKNICITRIHLEEDVGKSIHFPHYTGVDFNRAGVPLMEIVSEPELTSADEAYVYQLALKQVMQYAGISDCDMEKGQMRCDVNISLKPLNANELNPKTELKNLNSFKAAHRAINFEIERQSHILDRGDLLIQETRGWNDDKGKSYPLRSKESAHDYRYFPEPDLLPVEITSLWLESLKATLEETPAQKMQRFIRDFQLSHYDAEVLTQDLAVADYFERCLIAGAQAKPAANWIMVELLREMSAIGKNFAECPISPDNLTELLGLIEKDIINGRIAKTVFSEMFLTGKSSISIVEEKGLTQVIDKNIIDEFVQQVISAHPGPVLDFKQGKEASLQFLIGQVMKLSKGKANPKLAGEILTETLKN
jgi:aspartyl-tRNA(Asn)/glutamyl-tRNA(Gln) amidotransferase subunit B